MGEEYSSAILLRISNYNIAVSINQCKSVDIFTAGSMQNIDIYDITARYLVSDRTSYSSYIMLKDSRILSFSSFVDIVNLHKNYIEIPGDIFYNKSICFTGLIYHKVDDEYYALLKYSLSK